MIAVKVKKNNPAILMHRVKFKLLWASEQLRYVLRATLYYKNCINGQLY